MVHMVIGALSVCGIWLTVSYARRNEITVLWWQWLATGMAFGYVAFVLEIITAFVREGAVKAAVLVGAVFSFPAAAWGVLLRRFVFKTGEKGKKK